MSLSIINLPSLSGIVEAGLAIGPYSLPDDQKLPILCTPDVPADHESIKNVALAWAYRQYSAHDIRSVFCNGVAAIIDDGLVCYTDTNRGDTRVIDIADGEWKKVTSDHLQKLTAAEMTALQSIVTQQDMEKALMLVIATKVNWWTTNHHLKPGEVQGYLKNVMQAQFPGGVSMELSKAIHNMGRFVSTRRVMTLVGKEGILPVIHVACVSDISLKIADDVKVCFNSMPAGTHRLGIAYEAAKRLVRSSYAKYCPSVEDFKVLPSARKAVLDEPQRYHISASYLTGSARADFTNTDYERYLGRLGTFINTLFPKSTIAKSPHLRPDKVEGYIDYSHDFKIALVTLLGAPTKKRFKALPEEIGAIEECKVAFQ